MKSAVVVILALCGLVLGLSNVNAAGPATRPAAAAPATQPDPTSERLTFLTLRLSSAEESIKAINTALRIAGYKVAVAADKAEAADKGNELMDRKGGAPVPWDQFYGKTARSFIAPLPPGIYGVKVKGSTDNITYPWNDPIRRPKQFDYLYRANSEQAAKAKQQVEAMGRKIDALLARRRQLEAEQVELWGTIALESVSNREIATRPLYRFQLKCDGGAKSADAARVEIIRAGVLFLRQVDRAAAQAADAITTDPQAALSAVRQNIQSADVALRESILKPTDAAALSPAETQQLKDLMAIAKRMQLLCKNVTEGYALALESDTANDELRKQAMRAQLQEALIGIADGAGELDQAIASLAAAWKIHPEIGVDSPDKLPAAAAITTPKTSPSSPPASAGASVATAASAITVRCPAKVKVLTLERGAPRLYDSNPMRRIENFDASLSGWQFISIPQRVVIPYTVHVNKACTIYAFGKQGDHDQIFGKERDKWEPAGGAIEGKMISFAVRRRVSAGEDLSLGGFEIQIAAETIALDDDSKSAAPTDTRRSASDAPSSRAGVAAAEPARLFDGRSLAGWEGDLKCWSVADGAIRGVSNGKNETDLFSRAAYRNFIFEADVKFLSGNTGICFRAQPTREFALASGYEADLFIPNAIGKLAFNEEVISRPDPAVQTGAYLPREWNRYTIQADGDHIRLLINGLVMTDVTHDGVATGRLALQLHGPTEVFFRNLTIREMP
jgi:hypothetical protein